MSEKRTVRYWAVERKNSEKDSWLLCSAMHTSETLAAQTMNELDVAREKYPTYRVVCFERRVSRAGS